MKQIKLKNYLIYPGERTMVLPLFLDGLMLHGQQSRARTKFIRLLGEQVKFINEEKEKMISAVCKKNDKGEVVFLYTEIEEKDGVKAPVEKETTDRRKGQRYAFAKPEDEEKFEKDWQDFMAEEFVIDVLPSNSEVIGTVKELVLNTKEEFKERDAVMYSEWCDAFEAISEEPKEKKSKK